MKILKQFSALLIMLFCSCLNRSNQIEVNDMIRTTHQILLFEDKIIRVQRPVNEWDCCTSIQLLDKKGNLISETPCNDGKYPSLSVINDSIFVNYFFSSRESQRTLEPFKYYAKKYTTLGDYTLYYRFNSDFTGSLSPEYLKIDSVFRDSMTAYFFFKNIKVVEKNLQELFYDNNYCFYYYHRRDSTITRQYLEPTDSLLFVNYLQKFFQN